ncbi:alpha-hydroxy acid oxidase [Blastococcus sp. URHD0036]|uniref:alpha-hydroxy acid oxidase n=1 Tax=Blastococcus sp. URHD0036 TaxID=1380356 RepID=UPI0004972EC4|nr:alpha-hydroxy acid oxidase [Blastococcus sp. URHD0036]
MTDDQEPEFATLHEVVAAARGRLEPPIWDYLTGGGGTETTLARNRLALDRLALRPRVLRNVRGVDAGTSVFGRPIALPVALAPVGSVDSFDSGGLATVAAAADRCGVPIFCGGLAPEGAETVAAGTSGPKIYQAYLRGDDPRLDELVERVAALGYDAFCITVDAAHPGRRERDIARRFVKPWVGAGAHLLDQPTLSWSDVEHYRARHQLPLILKGIATAEDAVLAVEHGVDVVYVSNHGGRQLDHGRGALDVLPEVVAAVSGRSQVWVDGGVNRGTDVVKALALGADLVGIGRIYLYGLAAAGQVGVETVLQLLAAEVREALALCGVTSPRDLGPAFVTTAEAVRPVHVLSAFPLLAPALDSDPTV